METSLEWKQFIFIQDNAVYTLSYTATEASFDDYAQIVDDIVATLQFSK